MSVEEGQSAEKAALQPTPALALPNVDEGEAMPKKKSAVSGETIMRMIRGNQGEGYCDLVRSDWSAFFESEFGETFFRPRNLCCQTVQINMEAVRRTSVYFAAKWGKLEIIKAVLNMLDELTEGVYRKQRAAVPLPGYRKETEEETRARVDSLYDLYVDAYLNAVESAMPIVSKS